MPLPYEKLFPLTKGRLAEIVYFQVSSLTLSFFLFTLSLDFVTTDISKPAWLLNAVASKTQ